MDYALKLVKEASQTEPAVWEVTHFVKAIDADGKEVMVQGKKVNTNVPTLTSQVAQMESQLAKVKAIKADIESK